MASKRKSFSVTEKTSMIRAIENGESKSNVARRFGLNVSTVVTIWQNREKILRAEGKSLKRLRTPKFEDLDKAMLSWFNRQHQNVEAMSGPIVKAKAEKFAREQGIADFKASEGWLGAFKQRHNISFSKMNKELHNITMNVTHSVDLNTNKEINEVWLESEEEKLTPSDNSNSEKQNKDEVDQISEAPPTIQQALDAIKLIEKFIMYHKDDSSTS